MKSVEKSYTDILDTRNPLDISLLSTSPEFLIDLTNFLPDISLTFSQYLIPWFLIAVRQEVHNLESSVVL